MKAVEKGKAEMVAARGFPTGSPGSRRAIVPGVVARFVGMTDYRSDRI